MDVGRVRLRGLGSGLLGFFWLIGLVGSGYAMASWGHSIGLVA